MDENDKILQMRLSFIEEEEKQQQQPPRLLGGWRWLKEIQVSLWRWAVDGKIWESHSLWSWHEQQWTRYERSRWQKVSMESQYHKENMKNHCISSHNSPRLPSFHHHHHHHPFSWLSTASSTTKRLPCCIFFNFSFISRLSSSSSHRLTAALHAMPPL